TPQRPDNVAHPDIAQAEVEASQKLARVELIAPAPVVGIELGHVMPELIGPAQVEEWHHADGHAEAVAVAHGDAVGGETAHVIPGQYVRFPFRSNGEMLHHEIPDVLANEILEIARLRIDEEAAGQQDLRIAGQAAIRGSNDHWGQPAFR